MIDSGIAAPPGPGGRSAPGIPGVNDDLPEPLPGPLGAPGEYGRGFEPTDESPSDEARSPGDQCSHFRSSP